ncbi:unnamed protein product [Chrysoparadoxa australica]
MFQRRGGSKDQFHHSSFFLSTSSFPSHAPRLLSSSQGQGYVVNEGVNARSPSIAALGDGYVITWQTSGTDRSFNGVYGQVFDGMHLTVGEEFQANTYTEKSQEMAVVAPLDGEERFVVAWQSRSQDGSSWGVYGQLFDGKGVKINEEFQVNTEVDDSQMLPAVGGLQGGNFVVAWRSYGEDADSAGVFAQMFNPDGDKLGFEWQVNTYEVGKQEAPAVTGLSTGGFIITWQSQGEDGDGFGIYGQAYDAAGTPLGMEFQINSVAAASQTNPAIAALPAGQFVVAWQSAADIAQGSTSGVFGQVFDREGDPLGNEFKVNTYTIGAQTQPAVAALNDDRGDFVVSWTSEGQDGDGTGIFGQLFEITSRGASKLSKEFQINALGKGNQSGSSLASLTDGSFVAVYSGDDTGIAGVIAAAFDVDVDSIPLPSDTINLPGSGLPCSTHGDCPANEVCTAEEVCAIGFRPRSNNTEQLRMAAIIVGVAALALLLASAAYAYVRRGRDKHLLSNGKPLPSIEPAQTEEDEESGVRAPLSMRQSGHGRSGHGRSGHGRSGHSGKAVTVNPGLEEEEDDDEDEFAFSDDTAVRAPLSARKRSTNGMFKVGHDDDAY